MTLPFFEPNKPIVPIFVFNDGDGFTRFRHEFKYVSAERGGHLLLNLTNDIHVGFTDEQMKEMFDDPNNPLVYYPGRHLPEGARAAMHPQTFVGDLDDVNDQEEVLFKTQFAETFVRWEAENPKVTRSDDSMSIYVPKIFKEIQSGKTWKNKHATPSWRTLRNWIRTYERDPNPYSLMSRRGRCQKNTYFDAEIEALLRDYTLQYATDERLPMYRLHSKMKDAIALLNAKRPADKQLKIPSLKTFQNRVNDLPPAFIELGRNGEEAANRKFNAIHRGQEVVRLGQRTEMDEWRIDLRTLLSLSPFWKTLTPEQKERVPKITLWMTAIIDVASRCLLGFRVHRKAPSRTTAIGTLEMATIDKTAIAKAYGCIDPWEFALTPSSIAVDSATWYTATAFRVTVADLGATLFLPPAGKASARGTIERFFRTCSTQALEELTGRTWGSIEAKGDRNPDEEVSVTFDEVAPHLTRFFVDVYHNTPHAGLNGETPRNAWKRLRKLGITAPPTGERRRHIFGINVMRMIAPNGIRYLGIHYQSRELQHIRRRRRNPEVLVRIDRQNLGAVSVWDGDGWVSVPAVHEEFKGMSYWAWSAACSELRKKNLEKAELSRPTLRKAKADLAAHGEMMKIEAGLSHEGLTEDVYLAWEKKIDFPIKITNKASSLPEDFVQEMVLSEEFYEAVGITGLPAVKDLGKEKKTAEKDEADGWLDPRELPADDDPAPAASGSGLTLDNTYDSMGE
ncbi:Mu transposase C-terminal domain-containing protein [Ensifer sp. ENS12]|uniref:Mu transposase C-terminal domain-containing protein n=1 Tax=Ensifer sp. ENS12 TaxID=2854774 RepID=UPI001C44C207|nr:Mu transposase C-terminal domain-containing protein [Ensifer sp. ENS12]MBV7521158.1 DDE-type integrase/transposase/recombinase [Ensifer sp. ENS12]